jgi:hypothetical protein
MCTNGDLSQDLKLGREFEIDETDCETITIDGAGECISNIDVMYSAGTNSITGLKYRTN